MYGARSFFCVHSIDVDRPQWSLWRMQMIFNLISYLYFTSALCADRLKKEKAGEWKEWMSARERDFEACNLIWDSISWQLHDGTKWLWAKSRKKKSKVEEKRENEINSKFSFRFAWERERSACDSNCISNLLHPLLQLHSETERVSIASQARALPNRAFDSIWHYLAL